MTKRMKRAAISVAKRVAEEHGAVQAIVLLFDDDHVSGVSYGDTKASCARVAKTLNIIVDGLMEGKIQSPVLPKLPSKP